MNLNQCCICYKCYKSERTLAIHVPKCEAKRLEQQIEQREEQKKKKQEQDDEREQHFASRCVYWMNELDRKDNMCQLIAELERQMEEKMDQKIQDRVEQMMEQLMEQKKQNTCPDSPYPSDYGLF